MSAQNPLDEDDIIASLFAPLVSAAGADGLKDDAASLPGGPGDIVITCDALAAGVHFFADDPPGAIAQKAVRVNLSDLAAKGAEPFGLLLALALPKGTARAWAEDFAAGLSADLARYGVSLLGGDTLRASPDGGVMVTVTALGRTDEGATVRRRTARPGDALVVTGTIGEGALGLLARTGRLADNGALTARYLLPEPPVAAWRAVRRFARAAMDVSDGLLPDAQKLGQAAGVCLTIDVARVPLPPVAHASRQTLETALTGGDDYQILAAVPPEDVAAYCEALAAVGVVGTVIGAVDGGPPGVALTEGWAPVSLAGRRFSHF
ncbi:MAG: thiamine-phosphate kinase [Pseudomonadota bacterium]